MRSHLAATRIELRDLARCALGLQEVELSAYLTLLKGGPMTVKDLAKKTRRSRPTAQRILGNLVGKGLAHRKERIIDRGGYFFVYEATPAERVKKLIRDIVEEWYRKMEDTLDKGSFK
ncbi:helix-turn-helix domain-containing protein [Candidatus Bathyarchaeota archaeon]|nr:helix-turn-helix domain-containing protein [Candidatus Bathyarchaeota archaeon]